jgi:hypothetical protein
MKIKILIEYDDPNDIARPPQTTIKEWKKFNITPHELYKLLNNVRGNLFCRI